MKYLGLYFDDRLFYSYHIQQTVCKMAEKIRVLKKLTPSIGGPGYRSRKTLNSVAQGVALYAAPIWIRALKGGRNNTDEIVLAYRAVSAEAIQASYGAFTYRIKKTKTNKCSRCDKEDDPDHVFYGSPRWALKERVTTLPETTDIIAYIIEEVSGRLFLIM
ncbi:hypothetical protein HHI36_018709 [Cryptolaemus montrouzieri]|uniref:Reverse transcriptase n=1 Tax=Cryptolaemus montrouzieri TaxID=559131 RepID=A0ABD2P0W6_9CUCU